MEYLGNEYYIDNKTNYVYQSISKKDESKDEEDLEVEFVGMLEGKKLILMRSHQVEIKIEI